ncbi:MAG: prepilin-type N-terminal cleavage/methylation domain-containing protein [Cyanobacteria bacterium P01_G01_bin.39]
MQNKIRQKGDLGFTLIELMVALTIVGVIAAIATPSFVGLLNRIRVDNSLEELLGAIRETQKMAMRHGKVCQLNIDPKTKILSSTDNDCLLTTRNINQDVIIRTNLPGLNPNIPFSPRGTTTRMGTIVLSSDLSDTQKCFVISLGLGIMRTGNYTGSKDGSVSAQDCEKFDN